MLSIYERENRHNMVVGVTVQFSGHSRSPKFSKKTKVRTIGTWPKGIELAEGH